MVKRLFWTLLLLGLLIACGAPLTTEPPAPLPSSTAMPTTEPDTPTPTPEPTRVHPTPTVVVRAPWTWEVVRTYNSRDESAPVAFAGEVAIFASAESYGAGDYELRGVLYLEQGGQRRQIHTADKQMEISNVHLELPWLVWTDTPIFVLPPDHYTLWAYNLETQQKRQLHEVSVAEAPYVIASLALEGEQLVASVLNENGEICLRLFNLNDGGFSDLVCETRTPEPVTDTRSGGYPFVGFSEIKLRWPVLTYYQTTGKDEDGSDCRTHYKLMLPTGKPEVMATPPCGASIAGDLEYTFWGQPVKDREWYEFYVMDAAGKPQFIGRGHPNSLRVCDGRAFWIWQSSASAAEEVQSWKAGEPVQSVYKAPSASMRTFLKTCLDENQLVLERWKDIEQNQLLIGRAP